MERRGEVAILVVIVLLAIVVHIGIGTSVHLSLPEIAAAIGRGPGDATPEETIVWTLRLPRAILAAEVGAILGLVGAVFQSVFRNPLAEPYIVGASTGAALGGAAATVAGLGGFAFGLAVPLAAGVGAGLVLLLVFTLAGGTRAESGPLLLAGVAVGALAGSTLSLVILASGRDSNELLRWLLGSLSPAFWTTDGLLAVGLLIGVVVFAGDSRALTALGAGTLVAAGSGVDVGRVSRRAVVVGTALTAIAVGTVGIIGFLGLVAPHLARLRFGADVRRMLLPSTLFGALLLVLADIIAGRGSPTGELPVGVVTALLGAPSLLILLRRTLKSP